ncbi:expressed unknown protein [Seminavis robusta]|uniref:DUF262 domain-containing protein n=1 Tax=Seminavis robusta TaxID=568900 RepID=A0A9N8F1N4_9STRA|nr:expressed unknown protein [Seminavis robusta]|eukprot:Sro2558_g331200.1 n/a (577) ;mRNA; r:4242-6365
MRLPLIEIFSNRKYLLDATGNWRKYSWEREENEQLLDSLQCIGSAYDKLQLGFTMISTKQNEGERSRELGPNAVMYAVHDGQQRFVSINLLLAAIRDKCRRAHSDGPDSTAHNSWNAIAPGLVGSRTRGSRVSRIQNGSRCLEELLLAPEPVNTDRLNALVKSSSDTKIVAAFEFYKDKVEEMKPREIEGLYAKLVNSTYLFVMIFDDPEIPTQLLLSTTHGKNFENVDLFKGYACFDRVKSEERQLEASEAWEKLCECTSRKLVEDACVLTAEMMLGKVRPSDKGRHLSFFKDFFVDFIREHPEVDGLQIFERVLRPAVEHLHKFRGKPKAKLSKGAYELAVSFRFLQEASKLSTITKGIEVLVMKGLVNYKMPSPELTLFLKRVEIVVLWLLFAKPSLKERRECTIKILKLPLEPKSFIRSMSNEWIPDEGKKAIVQAMSSVNEATGSAKKGNKGRLPFDEPPSIVALVSAKGSKVSSAPCFGNLVFAEKKLSAGTRMGLHACDYKRLKDSVFPFTKFISSGYSEWTEETIQQNQNRLVGEVKDLWGLGGGDGGGNKKRKRRSSPCVSGKHVAV